MRVSTAAFLQNPVLPQRLACSLYLTFFAVCCLPTVAFYCSLPLPTVQMCRPFLSGLSPKALTLGLHFVPSPPPLLSPTLWRSLEKTTPRRRPLAQERTQGGLFVWKESSPGCPWNWVCGHCGALWTIVFSPRVSVMLVQLVLMPTASAFAFSFKSEGSGNLWCIFIFLWLFLFPPLWPYSCLYPLCTD